MHVTTKMTDRRTGVRAYIHVIIASLTVKGQHSPQIQDIFPFKK